MRVNTHQTQPIFSTPNAEITPLATLRHGAQQVSVIRQKMDSGHHNPDAHPDNRRSDGSA